jgi:pimeloyl-ACP methyl ester carboxylesterase
LHHGTGSSSSFDPRLSSTLVKSGFRVAAYDRLGFGNSDPLHTRELHRDFLLHGVDECLQVIDQLGLSASRRKVALVGHSDGASIALMCAALAPERVSCVVAEAPHMCITQLYSDALKEGFATFERTVRGRCGEGCLR